MDAILRGIILGLSITAPIGPTNVEVIRRGLKEGWRSAAAFCLGALVALIFYLLLAVFGLSFLAESPLANTLLLGFGVLVLAYLAYNSFRDFFKGVELDLDGQESSGKGHFLPGVVLTISNPAILLLWTGILGADLAASQASLRSGLALSLGILTGAAIFFSALSLLIHHGRRLLQGRYFRYVALAAGIVLGFFCLKFLSLLVQSI